MFCGITVVSASALGWLSWQLVWQDHALANQRALERRENAAGLAFAALQKHLSQVEERLTALANSPENEISRKAATYSQAFTADTVLLIFHAASIEAHPAGRLMYYPSLPPRDRAPAGMFVQADTLEFRQNDPARAIAILEELSRSPNHLVRAEALVRMGRNLRKAGRWREALSAYEQLARLQDAPAGGIPANLVARGALATLLEEHNHRERLLAEASALYADLHGARWLLTRPVYNFYADQARRWLGSKPVSQPQPGSLALSETAQFLWEELQQGKVLKGRQTLWVDDRSVLLLARSSPGRTVALVAGPDTIKSRWLAEIRPMMENLGAEIELADTEGHPVMGPLNAPAGAHSVRLASSTGLPWTLYATTVNPAAAADAFRIRSRLVIAGLFAIALLVAGGSYLIGRAVARELAVARLQSDFVAAVSHEFRTPLTALRQLSELLARGRVNSEEIRQQYYDVLEHESGRLHRLVEGLLKFGRMEAGAMRYQFETIDAGEFLRSLVEEFAREAARRGCRVELTANGSLPPVQADREALSCVVWNLLDNAVKYSPECQTVWVDAALHSERIAIRVRDKGVGIPRDDQQRIFQKFVRGQPAKWLGVQGTGVGLAVARQIVDQHGGEIKLESEPGAGSTFTVFLPVQS